ncbi:putative monooxygenase [Favolaschia claudopus]|uniref:Monooxygenase n=1 Tax=Favolaschia claudopus TaxID=2862362 RepID=A0AAW0BQC4_9AGAR
MPMSPITLTTVLCCIAGCFLVSALKYSATKRPPGPRRFPIIGNALQIPKSYEWETLSRWAKEYGDIVYLEAFRTPVVLLNSFEAAKELLEQRSAIYSNRPHLEMARLSGFDEAFVLQQYNNNSWRQERKIISQDLSSRSVSKYNAFLEQEARVLVRAVTDNPSELSQLVTERIGTILIRVFYGYYVNNSDDPFLTLIRASMNIFSQAAASGVWVVDSVPILKYLPTWLPGTSSLTTAQRWRNLVCKAVWAPYSWSKKAFKTGSSLIPNTCSKTFENFGEAISSEQEHQLAWAAGTMTAGGLETGIIGTLNFFLAMLLHPEVQNKAQEEITAAIGRDRLPTIADKPKLPYVRSIVTEVLRLNPPIPLGVAHALSQHDVYKDMHIPKGTLVVANIWHMLHDPSTFPNPTSFNPDRYDNLPSKMEDVTNIVFGFGRRTCPGKALAENMLFIIAATVLATCHIRPKVDEDGRDVVTKVSLAV